MYDTLAVNATLSPLSLQLVASSNSSTGTRVTRGIKIRIDLDTVNERNNKTKRKGKERRKQTGREIETERVVQRIKFNNHNNSNTLVFTISKRIVVVVVWQNEVVVVQSRT